MAATTTLADALLDDLDDLDDFDENDQEDELQNDQTEASSEGVKEDDEIMGGQTAAASEKRKRLLDDPALLSCLSQIHAKNKSFSNTSTSSSSSSKDDDEHHFIQQCNKQLTALDEEMHTAHLELMQAYEPKFPELADLIVHPLQYKNAVQVIQNETDMTHIQDKLHNILSSNQILTISVAATTTSATTNQLSTSQLDTVNQACLYMDQVQENIQILTNYVKSQMSDLAPNTCALIGPTIASQMLGMSGGLAELSKIPACNMQVLGQTKHNSSSRAGMSSVGLSLHSKMHSNYDAGNLITPSLATQTLQPHTGILFHCDLVQKCPAYLQKKALKTVAAKLALAVRCDYVNVESGRKRTSENGLKFRAIIEEKIAKWEEPDKARVLKALPK